MFELICGVAFMAMVIGVLIVATAQIFCLPERLRAAMQQPNHTLTKRSEVMTCHWCGNDALHYELVPCMVRIMPHHPPTDERLAVELRVPTCGECVEQYELV